MKTLLKNFPYCDKFDDDSFIGIWHEESIFNIERYRELEQSIYSLASKITGSNIPRSIAWPIAQIFSYVMMSIQAHYDLDDNFQIANLTNSEINKFRERFQAVVEGFFNGTMPEDNVSIPK